MKHFITESEYDTLSRELQFMYEPTEVSPSKSKNFRGWDIELGFTNYRLKPEYVTRPGRFSPDFLDRARTETIYARIFDRAQKMDATALIEEMTDTINQYADDLLKFWMMKRIHVRFNEAKTAYVQITEIEFNNLPEGTDKLILLADVKY